MKKIGQVCCLLIGLTTASYAQVAHPSTANPEEKAKGLQKQLTLTGDQATRVAAIYKESAEKFEKINKAEHGSADKMTKSISPLRAATIKKIKGVLTPDQAAKFDALIKHTKKNGANDWGEGWSAGSGN